MFLYTNVELNLPPHLNYDAALPCKCTQRIVHVKPLTFCAKKHQTLFRRTCGIQISQIWTQSITRYGLSCNIVSTRQISVAWMNGGWLTSGVALNSRLSTWLLKSSVEDFERASIRKEDNLNTNRELAILIVSLSVTFSVTFVWMLPCYIFHSKSVPATSTIWSTRVFVSQGSATAKLGYGGRFYSTLWHRYLLSDMQKNY